MPYQSARPRWLLMLAWLANAVAAQTPTPSQPPAITPILTQPLQYRSSISHYQAYSEQAVQPWREANDRVQRLGGWRAYAKERSDEATPSGAHDSAGHHGMHGGMKP